MFTVLFLIGIASGVFAVDRRRLGLVAALIGTATLATLAQVLVGVSPSLLSFALLIVLYLPALLRPRGDAVDHAAIGRFFVRLMAVAALLSILQFAVQFLGLTWHNWISELVPAQFVLQDFNDGNPIVFGSDINRATALVFLEPSFLSLFLGIAVVVAMRLRMGWPLVSLLLLGIVPTVAGNGVVIVALAAIVWLFLRSRDRLLALVPALALTAVMGVLTPLGALFIQRATEGGSVNSSSGLRFVQPYVLLVPPPLQHVASALVGEGAGSTSDWIAAHIPVTEPLLATVFPKILFEFGLLGIVGMLVPLMVLFLAPLRRQPEMFGVAVAFFVVNGSLLTPLMVYLAVLVLVWFSDLLGGRAPMVAGSDGRLRSDAGEQLEVRGRSGPLVSA